MFMSKQDQQRLETLTQSLEAFEALSDEVRLKHLEDTEKGPEYESTQLIYGQDPDGYFGLINDVLDAAQDFLYPIEPGTTVPDRSGLIGRVFAFKQATGLAVTYDFSHDNQALIVVLKDGYINLSDQSVTLIDHTCIVGC